MRKALFCFPLAAILAVSVVMAPLAQAAKPAPQSAMHLETSKADLADVTAIQEILRSLMEASNKHDIDSVLRHYAPGFISGDSLSLKDIRGLIQDTWQTVPHIKYDSQ